MTSQEHRDQIIAECTNLFKTKYDKGAAEHGGLLADVPVMPEIVNEVLDLISYVFTLKAQHNEVKRLLKTWLDTDEKAEDVDDLINALNILEHGNPDGETSQRT